MWPEGVYKPPCDAHLAEWGVLLTRPGYTPLHMAVGYSHMPVAAALLEAGADPEVWPLDACRHGMRGRTASVLLALLCEKKYFFG